MNINEKRYDDSVKLALALGEIDDALIEEARTPYPIFMTTKRLVTLAASLLVVVIVGIAAIGLAPAFMPAKDAMGGDAAPEQNNSAGATSMYGVGDVVKRGDSSIVLIDKTNGKYTFLLTLAEDVSSLDIYVYGYKFSSPEDLLANGGKLTEIVATTAENAPDGFDRVDMPRVLINGTESTTLPKNAGTYTVTIDTLPLASDGCVLDRFGITYFNATFKYN
ncbi:MAG: hypothetical protein IJW03_00870 [Clostridia bacterium]|nr:hypothetical protein [Clostridia bacterium]